MNHRARYCIVAWSCTVMEAGTTSACPSSVCVAVVDEKGELVDGRLESARLRLHFKVAHRMAAWNTPRAARLAEQPSASVQ